MKTEIKITFIGLLLGLFLVSCKEPGPVELIDDDISREERLDVEILSPEPDVFVYSGRYDTTGIFEPLPPHSSLIIVSGIQNTYKNINIHSIYDAAMFFDRSRPVYGSNQRIVGYHMNRLGTVYFNSERAGEKNYRIRYMAHGGEKDTLLGKYHQLSRLFSPDGQFAFPYDSHVNFELEMGHGHMQNVSFDIPTPEKVIGEVKLLGNKDRRDVAIDLHWNRNSRRDALIEIVIGGYSRDRDGILPIVKFKTMDDGFLRIPRSIMRSIPFDKHPSLLFTFSRRLYKNVQNDRLPDNHILSQSIHNIRVDVP